MRYIFSTLAFTFVFSVTLAKEPKDIYSEKSINSASIKRVVENTDTTVDVEDVIDDSPDVYGDEILDLNEANDYYVTYKVINPEIVVYQNENLSKKLCSGFSGYKFFVAVYPVEKLKKNPLTGQDELVYKITPINPKQESLCENSTDFTIPLKDALYGYVWAKDIEKTHSPIIDDSDVIDGDIDIFNPDDIFNSKSEENVKLDTNIFNTINNFFSNSLKQAKQVITKVTTTNAKLLSFYTNNYGTVRNDVKKWFAKKYSPTATQNACVAHATTSLKMMGLKHPKPGTLASINVDALSVWFKNNNWKRVNGSKSLQKGDFVFSGSLKNLTHVYVFSHYYSPAKKSAYVLDNQARGLHPRGFYRGPTKFAYRLP